MFQYWAQINIQLANLNKASKYVPEPLVLVIFLPKKRGISGTLGLKKCGISRAFWVGLVLNDFVKSA
jgi:hypothetical protein